MASSSPSSPAGRPTLSRRGFLAVSAAGLAVLAGCTAEPDADDEPVTEAQVDGLADQVAVQEALVAAYATAGQADPALATDAAGLAAQAGDQLERLRAAAPDAGSSASAASSSAAAGPDPRAWLRGLVTDAAASHAAACREQSGARAALLGSIAAGLRGQAAVLA